MNNITACRFQGWRRNVLLVAITMGSTTVHAQSAQQQSSQQAAPASASTTDTTRLSTLVVQGKSLTPDNNDYVAGHTGVSLGLPLSVKETPQSVSVVTRQQMNDQQMENLGDVLTNTTGITSSSQDNGGRTTFRSRGYDISNFKVDGLEFNGVSGLTGTGNSLNMDLYDHVAVVRGANGLMGGTGDPSATIYMERKRPGYQPHLDVKVTGGNWGKRRIMVDGSTPLTSDGRVRARTVLSYENSDTFRQHEKIKNFGGLFNVVANPTDSTTVNMGIERDQIRHDGATWGTNVPIWYADGSKTHLARNTNPVADWSFLRTKATTLFFNIDQNMANDWKLHTSFASMHSSNFDNLGEAKVNNSGKGEFGGFWNQDGSGARLNALHSEAKARRVALDINAHGPFRLFGHTHELIAGINGYRDTQTDYNFGSNFGNCSIDGVDTYSPNGCQYRATGLAPSNWSPWDDSAYPNFNAYRTKARKVTRIENYGGYLAGRFTIVEPLKLILGGRFSTYRTYATTYNKEGASSRGDRTTYHGEFTPYAGLVYNLNDNNTLYTSYTSIFKPQSAGTVDAHSNLLDPEKGKSYEAGWKTSFMDNRVNTELALFKNKKNNVADSTGDTDSFGNTIYRSVNGVKSKGIDAEISGQLTPSWNINAGYTYLDESGLGYREDPRHLFHMFTTYQMPGALENLTLGGGVTYQTSREWNTNPGRPLGDGKYDSSNLKTKGYALVNLMANYKFTPALTGQLNIENLTDKRYYKQYGFYDGMLFGQPRTVTASLSYHFF